MRARPGGLALLLPLAGCPYIAGPPGSQPKAPEIQSIRYVFYDGATEDGDETAVDRGRVEFVAEDDEGDDEGGVITLTRNSQSPRQFPIPPARADGAWTNGGVSYLWDEIAPTFVCETDQPIRTIRHQISVEDINGNVGLPGEVTFRVADADGADVDTEDVDQVNLVGARFPAMACGNITSSLDSDELTFRAGDDGNHALVASWDDPLLSATLTLYDLSGRVLGRSRGATAPQILEADLDAGETYRATFELSGIEPDEAVRIGWNVIVTPQ